MKYLLIITVFLSISINAQWIYQNTNINGVNTEIFFIDSLTGYIGGNTAFGVDEYILKTTDGGSNWIKYSLMGNPTSIFFINSDIGFCTTQGQNHIYKTVNAGATWEVNYSDSLSIWNIYFFNDTLGWAVAGDFWKEGIVLKTTDQGNHWQQNFLSTMNSLRAIKMLNASVGFIVGGHPSKIWKTENGGNNWYLIFQDPPGISVEYLNDIAFLNDSIGFAVGSKLLKTSDGGEHWEELTLPIVIYYSVATYNNKCWIIAQGFNYSHILFTNDYGLNWIPIISPILSQKSYFINDTLGWFCGYGNNVLKTYSGGLTTITYPSIPNLIHPNQNQINVHIPVEFEWTEQNYCYFQIQVCLDSIFSFPIFDTLLIENKIFADSSYLNPFTNYFWRVRSTNIAGTSEWSDIGKFTTSTVLGVSDKTILPEFSLSQNYPNPFNPFTNIFFKITKRTKVTLTIYNLLGQIISVLINEEKSPGEYETIFTPSNISSGVFIYQLKTSSGVLSKKMVYIK